MKEQTVEKKIKVLYEASILNNFDSGTANRSGIYWVAYNLLRQLNLKPELELYLYSNDYNKTKQFIDYVTADMPEVKLFNGDVKQMDVVFSPCLKIHDDIRKTGINCFTLLHDCIPLILPQYFDDAGTGWFINMFRSLNSKDYCFSNSEYTKKDFLKFCPELDADKITTIPLSTNQPYQPNKNLTTEIRKKYNIPTDKKYLFSLCSLEPRKNLIRAMKTFIQFIKKNKIDDLVFVLGGGAWDGFIERFEKEVPDYAKYKDKIIRAGYVDDEDMNALYSNAEWFVYTSQYEGFGMPPLEAMACGTAVITSNNSSLPEVVGDAGIMIDWDSDEQHVAAYEKYYFDKKFRDKMAKKGLERSKQFSWEKAADIMVEQFKKCPENPNRTSFILQNLYNSQAKTEKIKVKLFGFLPLAKIKKSSVSYKLYLFGFLPLYERKQVGGRKVYKFLGLPVFKVRKMANGITTKYYVLGLPVLKISRKKI